MNSHTKVPKRKHKHEFTWGITNYELSIDNSKRKKVIVCTICKKSLNSIIAKLERRL